MRVTEKDGKKMVEGFVFAPDRVSGMQDLAENTQWMVRQEGAPRDGKVLVRTLIV